MADRAGTALRAWAWQDGGQAGDPILYKEHLCLYYMNPDPGPGAPICPARFFILRVGTSYSYIYIPRFSLAVFVSEVHGLCL